MNHTNRPLCVDLDGTLLKTDLLHESAIRFLKCNPFNVFLLFIWLTKGRSYLKDRIAQRINIDIDLLPYNEDVLKFCHRAAQSGQNVYLVTASHTNYAQLFLKKFSFLNDAWGSTEMINLKGKEKAKFLTDKFGENNFDYIGDSSSDKHIWKAANKSHLVSYNNKTFPNINFSEVFNVEKNKLKHFIKALRIYQWAKNLLLFVPLFLSHKYLDVQNWLPAIFSFLSFSFIASSIYLFNDLLDLESDRKHHKKKSRPLANGNLSMPFACLALLILLTGSFSIASMLPAKFLMIIILYFLLNILYTFQLKKLPIIDVLLLSSFYMLRLQGGGYAVEIYISHWLNIFSLFIFISLGFLKRYGELYEQFKNSGRTEVSGRGYNTGDLNVILIFGIVSAQMSVLSFTLYLFLGGAAKHYNNPKLLTINAILIFFWLSSIWFKGARGKVHGDPVRFAMTDKESLAIALLSVANLLFVKWLSI